MLTAEENERLTRVGPGTPMGALMRRYWQPVATAHEIHLNPVKAVTILGERLTLFRERGGKLGLIGQRCAHRLVDLKHGIPEAGGLRCPYHGWMYDTGGQCVHQPNEGARDFKASVKLPSYPVQEMGGLIWAYLGPDPAPQLPPWDLFVTDNAFRQIGTTVLPCNWLQCQENSLDTVHVEWAHGRLGRYVMERKGFTEAEANAQWGFISRHHEKIDFKRVDIGIQKMRLLEGDSEDTESWRTGHPMIFPNWVRIGQRGYSEFQMRIPMDDTHTWHIAYQTYFPGPINIPKQDPVPAFEVPRSELPDFVLGQDFMCWVAQGDIADRTQERLGKSDVGISMFRRMLMEQMEIVAKGGDPINTYRDLPQGARLGPAQEHYGSVAGYKRGDIRRLSLGHTSPVTDELDELFVRGAAAAAATQTPSH